MRRSLPVIAFLVAVAMGTSGPALAGSQNLDSAASGDRATANNPPVLTAPTSLFAFAFQPFSATATASDPDGDAVTLSQTNNAPFLPASSSTGPSLNPSLTVSGTGTIATGAFTIAWTAVDSNPSPATSAATTTIISNPSNQAPVITAPSTVSAVVGILLSVTASAADPDGSLVTLSQTNDAAFLSGPTSAGPALNPSLTLSGVPTNADAGSHAIQWTAVDSGTPVLTATASTSFLIQAINAPPVITAPATASGIENSAITIAATATDADAIPLVLSQTNNAPFLPASSSAGPSVNPSLALTGVPTFSQAGNYTIDWSAFETAPPGLSTTAATALFIANLNRPPVISAPATIISSTNVPVSVTGSAADPDAQTVTLSQTNNAPFLTGPASAGPALNPSITLTGTPNFTQNGSYTVSWSALDSNVPGGSASATTAVTISGASNRVPVISAPASVNAQATVPLTVTGSASDPDAENVTLSQTNNAPFLAGPASSGPSLNPSITLTGTPSFSQEGSYSIQWTAVDSHLPAGTATATTSIVFGPHRNPVILVPPTVSGTVGTPVSITASASSPDGDLVTLCVLNGAGFLVGPSCAGPSLNPVLTLSGTPTQVGSFTIQWTATDTSGGVSSAITTLTVSSSEGRPVLDQPASMTVNEGATATQQLTASDPDGDPLTFSKVGTGPFFMSVSSAGLVTLAPGFTDAGSYTGTVMVTDGTLTDQKSFAITVVNVNRCPTANAGGPYSGVLFVAVAFDGTGSSDPDGDPLSYAWDFGDGTTGAGAMTSHTYTITGTYPVTLTIGDGACTAAATTTAAIADGFAAIAFTTGGNGVVSLNSGKPFACVEIEPVGGSFDVAQVDLGTVKMLSMGTGSVSEIAADAGKTSVAGDKNNDGVTEIHACFTKPDLRLLFSGLPAGRNDVTVSIVGSLATGGSFHASLALTVKSTGGALAASVSPNPLNPSAKVTFATSRAGALSVRLFDLAGRLVRTYLDEPRAVAGYHDVTIDGRSATGSRLASGVYFVTIVSEHDGTETKSLVVLK